MIGNFTPAIWNNLLQNTGKKERTLHNASQAALEVPSSFCAADHSRAVPNQAPKLAAKLAGARRGFRRAPLYSRQSAYKPGSGRHANAFACVTAIPLGRQLPGASSNLPGRQDLDIDPGDLSRLRGAGLRAVPIRSCSRWGLPCRLRCRRRGALLPHRFTLAASREGAAVCSLWHFP